jgi:hypothetical protein
MTMRSLDLLAALLLAPLLLVALAACNGSSPKITLDGSVDGFGPDCKFECVGELQCRDGFAYARTNAPVPCVEWVGSCPGTTAQCSGGCDLVFSAHRTDDWSGQLAALCRDTQVAKVGDSCANQCLPTRAVADAQGNVTQQYLACTGGTCAAAAAPSVGNYLGACGAMAVQFGAPGVTGVVSDGTNACLLAWDTAAGKTRQGSTIFCIGDWECPSGSSCDDSLPFVDDVGVIGAVCRPGARGAALLARLPAP